MTLDSKRYFSNALVGTPQVGADIDVTSVDANPKYAVGFGFTRADGNKYRYGYAAAGVTVGALVAPTFASSGLATATTVILPASATSISGDIMKPGSIGSRWVQITKASVASKTYAGGYFIVEDGSGKGYTYRIKSNTATGTPVAGDFYIELFETLKANLSGDTYFTITPSMWNDVVTADITTNVITSGVAQATTTTTSPYGWFCTKGHTACLQDGTIVKGQGVMLSTVTAGAVSLWGGTYTTVAQLLGLANVGFCTAIGATTKYANIFLSIE